MSAKDGLQKLQDKLTAERDIDYRCKIIDEIISYVASHEVTEADLDHVLEDSNLKNYLGTMIRKTP